MAHITILQQTFRSLDRLYDVLEGTDYADEIEGSEFPATQARAVQDKVNSLLTELENIMPGLQAEINDKK